MPFFTEKNEPILKLKIQLTISQFFMILACKNIKLLMQEHLIQKKGHRSVIFDSE